MMWHDDRRKNLRKRRIEQCVIWDTKIIEFYLFYREEDRNDK